ncbi:NAD(P)/FAD-dependent oxidoreductase [Oceanibacterium hippocampi]|uniref:D-amino acid dehydrogenase small subunit n=1 Tax=Oceanibacterium hippocampi TaxID=745714 RepID=A0A1Y5TFA3_9PROT|nr:FAD-dependent oxidoreductase [Oceanibacterium hippocampi]SLN58991.1 D-amino acid dehydrogenase small subunit [Oceanibacterium hippocampi]
MTGRGHVVVLGAGMVGTASAVHLLRRGFQVTLVDRKGPAGETSYGNAGVISRGSIMPVMLPSMWRALPRYMSNADPSVWVDWRYLPAIVPWLARLARAITGPRLAATVAALDALARHALAEHEALMQLSGAGRYLVREGWMKLYRSEASFRASGFERARLDEAGIRHAIYDPAALAEREPSLRPLYARALHILDTASLTDPGAVCESHARWFREAGGALLIDGVEGIEARDDGYRVRLPGRHLDADHVVVALGPWSRDFLKPLGYRLPMDFERGYHLHFTAGDGASLARPVCDIDGGFVLAPMEKGIRVTSGVEFAGLDAPASRRQIDKVVPLARAAFPLGEPLQDEPWLGRRPSFPDSLPVIGPAPRHPGLWFAFGHGHIGLTLGPVTGRLVAEIIAGDTPLVDLAPYAATRFDAA